MLFFHACKQDEVALPRQMASSSQARLYYAFFPACKQDEVALPGQMASSYVLMHMCKQDEVALPRQMAFHLHKLDCTMLFSLRANKMK